MESFPFLSSFCHFPLVVAVVRAPPLVSGHCWELYQSMFICFQSMKILGFARFLESKCTFLFFFFFNQQLLMFAKGQGCFTRLSCPFCRNACWRQASCNSCIGFQIFAKIPNLRNNLEGNLVVSGGQLWICAQCDDKRQIPCVLWLPKHHVGTDNICIVFRFFLLILMAPISKKF